MPVFQICKQYIATQKIFAMVGSAKNIQFVLSKKVLEIQIIPPMSGLL